MCVSCVLPIAYWWLLRMHLNVIRGLHWSAGIQTHRHTAGAGASLVMSHL